MMEIRWRGTIASTWSSEPEPRRLERSTRTHRLWTAIERLSHPARGRLSLGVQVVATVRELS